MNKEDLSNILENENLMTSVLGEISELFKTNQEELKFQLLDFFHELFSQQKNYNVIINIRDGLKDILSNKLGNEERDKALSLVMLLLDRFGGRWLFSPNIDEDFSHKKLSKYPKEKVNEDFKFAALVIQLALCYTILEKSIEYFSQFENYLNSQDDNVEVAIKFDPEILLKIKGILTETFRAIIDNLLEFKEYTKNDVKAAINDFKILASIRVLSSWLAEENEFQKEVSLLMPFLINICSYSEKENLELNLVKIMMPAYLNLTSQEEPQDAFLSHDFVNDVLGPIQVLLNIIVSEREKFVIRNEKEISKVMKICFQILNLLETDLYPIPSHADWTYLQKYGVKASSGDGRASARETIGRVAAGAIAEKYLKMVYKIDIVAFVSSVSNIKCLLSKK
ncbi:20836_t:CDS:2 [Entrophospora sp. SA101]|nr:20836_t:CDS:2 [Entrophospora sp. SA101]